MGKKSAVFYAPEVGKHRYYRNNLESSTQKWNSWIAELNDGITTFGTHFALISFSLVKWKDLASILDNLEKLNIYADGYKQLAIYALILGVILIIISPLVKKLMAEVK